MSTSSEQRKLLLEKVKEQHLESIKTAEEHLAKLKASLAKVDAALAEYEVKS